MRVISTKCPNCGRPVDMDYDHLQKYCGSCGCKLLLEIEDIARIIQAREQTKRERIRVEAEERMHAADLRAQEREKAYERRQNEIDLAKFEKASSPSAVLKAFFYIFIFYLFIMLIAAVI